MTFVHPISRAWISTGGTGAQNYDEFADENEITTIIEQNPFSALSVEMPHRAPQSAGADFTAALPDAAQRLKAAKDAGRYAPHEDVIGVYRIATPGAVPAMGVFAMVDTDQISTRADEPGRVIRNEDVFLAKVAERVELTKAIGHLLSPVLLLQSEGAQALRDEVAAIAAAGPPAVGEEDKDGRVHEIWPVTGEQAARLATLAAAGDLVVADGNHRSLAAQTAGLPRFLAVITTPDSVVIEPYQRLITSLSMSAEALLDQLRKAGAAVVEADADATASSGTVVLYAKGRNWLVDLPVPDGATGVEALDHTLVEDAIIVGALGLDPGADGVRYIGGDYPDAWLRGQVDSGAAELAVLIAPVTVPEFVQVNLHRQKMPRKSTWFTPKARAGLVVADVHPAG